MGDPGQPRGAEGHRPAAVDQGLDGEADACRPRQARGDPHRRGTAAGSHPDRRGRQAGRHPQRRGRPRVPDPPRPGRPGVPDPQGAGRGAGHPDRLPGDPRRATRPVAAGLPVPPDDAEDRRGQRQQGVDRAQRDRQGAGGPRLHDEHPPGDPRQGRGPAYPGRHGPDRAGGPRGLGAEDHPRGGGRGDRGSGGVQRPGIPQPPRLEIGTSTGTRTPEGDPGEPTAQ